MQSGSIDVKIQKVLILTSDIYSRLGGGEQVYRTLIEDNPEIDFYFFSSNIPIEKKLPKNAHSIPLKIKPTLNISKIRYRYNTTKSTKVKNFFNPNEINAAELAEQYASSVANRSFDLIDIPEYEIVGNYLRESLFRNRVNFKALSLFIHGSLSKTLEFDERISRDAIREIRDIEEKQRNDVDIYFILDSWYPKLLGLKQSKCIQIDPWLFIKRESAFEEPSQIDDSKSLVFFGRWERRKGIDLLPNLIPLMEQDNIKLKLAGTRKNSEKYADAVALSANYRNILVENLPITDSGLLYNSLGENDVLVIPSRFDSFNLVALEGIARGKKVAISKECGAYHHLSSFYPTISFIQISSRDLIGSAINLSKSLEDTASYESGTKRNLEIVDVIFERLDRDQFTSQLNIILENRISLKTHTVHGFVFKKFTLKRIVFNHLRVLEILSYVRKYLMPIKRNTEIIRQKFLKANSLGLIFLFLQGNSLTKSVLRKIDRKKNIFLYRPLHFLELSENRNFSLMRRITYGIRSLRFSGYRSKSIQSANLVSDLKLLGLIEESKALDSILSEQSEDKVFDYLENRRIELLNTPLFSFNTTQVLHSKASRENPKISVIVSDFNAASKLPLFLNRLALCPELKDGSAEILLIDANSNTPDAEISIKLADKLGISLRAIRVSKRITIQEAWNYGITQSLGKYLCFLGVDESVFPTALTELSSILSSNEEIDWVMSNSVVSEVDSDGGFMRDLMTYNREDADASAPFLETCFVSYVGGMYKKSVHEKFGYYDSTFRGAGDTEFKSRVLPSLKVKYLDCTLGEFLNYPEERTTATERIELEDIRAWYIFRTPGGLKYQASLAGDGFLENLGWKSLGYRKSYCGHMSTDLEIASAIYNISVNGNYGISNNLLEELKNAHQQLQAMRKFLGFGSHKWQSLSFRRIYLLAKWFDIDGRKSAAKGVRRMRLDNMFEQHIWYW